MILPKILFFYIALYLGAPGGAEFQLVRTGNTFAECHEVARRAEIDPLPFGEEAPITSECFALELASDSEQEVR